MAKKNPTDDKVIQPIIFFKNAPGAKIVKEKRVIENENLYSYEVLLIKQKVSEENTFYVAKRLIECEAFENPTENSVRVFKVDEYDEVLAHVSEPLSLFEKTHLYAIQFDGQQITVKKTREIITKWKQSLSLT